LPRFQPAPMAIVTPEIVTQVALLARLRLESEALAETAAQLDHILEYVRRLQAVPTDGDKPLARVNLVRVRVERMTR